MGPRRLGLTRRRESRSMARGNAADIKTFAEARSRLEEIVKLVRDKELPLDKSLDLFEEAIELGNRCADLIDDTEFSAEELAGLAEAHNTPEAAGTEGGQAASGTQQSGDAPDGGAAESPSSEA